MQYYEYLKSHPESLIVRFYGCYQLNMLNGEPLFITVMASAFSNPQLKMSEVYDLKVLFFLKKKMKLTKRN